MMLSPLRAVLGFCLSCCIVLAGFLPESAMAQQELDAVHFESSLNLSKGSGLQCPEALPLGVQIGFEGTFSNTGEVPINNVTFTVDVSSHLSLSDFQTSQGAWQTGARNAQLNMGTVGPGVTVNFSFLISTVEIGTSNLTTQFSGESSESCNIEIIPPSGNIFVEKFHDLNGNGEREQNEPGLAGWQFFLDEDGNQTLDPSERTATTDTSGQALFDNVPLGDYGLIEVDQEGWVRTLPADFPGYIANLQNPGESLLGVFGNFQVPVIDPIANTTNHTLYRVDDRFGNPTLDMTLGFQVDQIFDPSVPFGFANGFVDFNRNGIIDFHTTGSDTTFDWAVQNVPVPLGDLALSDPSINFWFPIGDDTFDTLDPMPGAVLITPDPFPIEVPMRFDFLPTNTIPFESNVDRFNWGDLDLEGQDAPEVPLVPVTFDFLNIAEIFYIPGVLDPNGMPDITQKTNECGPTSAANSLIWLAKKHGFTDKLPQAAGGGVDEDQLIQDLMTAMTGSNARPFGGLRGNQLYDGKKKYIQEKKLPLVVEGGQNDPNASGAKAFEFMKNELKKGQDVELLVKWPGPGAHWVTVTGFSHTPGGRAFVYVHDPDDKMSGQATWELEVNGSGEITGKIKSPKEATIMWAVAESPATPIIVPSVGDLFEPELFRPSDRFGSAMPDGTFDFSVPSVSSGLDFTYLNVFVDLNNDGVFGPYPTGKDVEQPEWVLQNIPLPGSEGLVSTPGFRAWFPLPDMTLDPKESFRISAGLTVDPIDVPGQIPIELVQLDLVSVAPIGVFEWGANDLEGQIVEQGEDPVPEPLVIPEITFVDFILGPNDPNGMPDITQKTNECGPTSAANSLIWLARKHNFTNRLPQKDGAVDEDALILALMQAMAGNQNRPFDGLRGNQLHDGKKKYIEDNNLPLVVHGGNTDPDASGAKAFEFIKKEVARGQDVELLVKWPGSDTGSHWVTISGYATSSDGKAILLVHDPDDGKTAEVVWELEVNGDGDVTGKVKSPAEATMLWAVAESPVANIGTEDDEELPQSLHLDENYPNPFESSTTIRFALPEPSHVTLRVIDVLGREVRMLVDGVLRAGDHEVVFDASGLVSGTYVYELETGGRKLTRLMVVAR